MKRLSVKLAAVLGFQLVLALILWGLGPDYSAFKAKEPLLAFEAAKVDRIEISEGGAASVALVKEGGNWTIPSFAGFPADGAKVNSLLAKVSGLKKGWPVASSADAAKRFKVTGDAYERKIVLKSAGKETGEILLGTSPAFKQVHVRAGNDGNVYSVAFSPYEAGARGEDWMDRSLLNIPQDQIASISLNDVTLERKDGKFVLGGLAPGEKPNESAIYQLAGALSYPAFDAVVGKGAEALAKVNEPTIEVTVKRTASAPTVLKYKKEADGGAYLFASSANGFLFRASEAATEPIVKGKREALVEAPKKADAESPKPAALPAKLEEPKQPGGEGTQTASAPAKAPEPAKPQEPKQPGGESTQAASELAKPSEPAKAGEPKKSGDESTQVAAEPGKAGDAAKAEADGAQAATEPPRPGQPHAPNGG